MQLEKIIGEQVAARPLWDNERIDEAASLVGWDYPSVQVMREMRDEYEQMLNTVRRNWYTALDEAEKQRRYLTVEIDKVGEVMSDLIQAEHENEKLRAQIEEKDRWLREWRDNSEY